MLDFQIDIFWEYIDESREPTETRKKKWTDSYISQCRFLDSYNKLSGWSCQKHEMMVN